MAEKISKLKKLFKVTYGVEPAVKALTGGGSPRSYFRLIAGSKSVIGAFSEEIKENKVFLELDSMLERQNIKVPHIIKIDDSNKCYLMQDLGDVSLFSLLLSEEKMDLSKRALSELINIQTISPDIWESKVNHSPFSSRLVNWDLNYFKYDFLKPSHIAFDEDLLEDDFENLTKELCSQMAITGLMYRDFQSRNIMVKDGALWFIDFQGARRGPLTYDAVSYIWQAKAPFSFKEREELMKYYSEMLAAKANCNSADILSQMNIMGVFRTLQVLGAYGYRGLIEKKSHFLESIPFAANNLRYFKDKGELNKFPELAKVVDGILTSELMKTFPMPSLMEGLTLSVFSFSYKKGYPVDSTGNGGGFMFDCRGIHNPGRYGEYKDLSGRDVSVKEFLNTKTNADQFVENSLNLVVPSIENYLKRGFTSLQVGFGCTGGQHRSVYCAEKFAKEMRRKFSDIQIKILHREQDMEYYLK